MQLRLPITGFSQFVHSVSTLTTSVSMNSLRCPFLLADIPITSESCRRCSVTVLSLDKGGRKMWTCEHKQEKVRVGTIRMEWKIVYVKVEVEVMTDVWLRTPGFRDLFNILRS